MLQKGFYITTIDTNLYFGSRTIVSRGVTVAPDRLGSNYAGGSRYFPYGEEQQVTAQDRDKFATYYRDSTTTLDYADQRYYASTLGRFMTVDRGPADPNTPLSFNRYAYAAADPVNNSDPTGLVTVCLGIGALTDDPSGLSTPCDVFYPTTISIQQYQDIHPPCWSDTEKIAETLADIGANVLQIAQSKISDSAANRNLLNLVVIDLGTELSSLATQVASGNNPRSPNMSVATSIW